METDLTFMKSSFFNAIVAVITAKTQLSRLVWDNQDFRSTLGWNEWHDRWKGMGI